MAVEDAYRPGATREPQADVSDLIASLIEGIVEEPLWSTFLTRLRERTQGDYASIVFRPLPFGTPENRVIHLYSGQPSPPDISRLYRETLFRDDPMPYRDLLAGRLYALSELLRAGDPAHEAYHRRFLVPSGMNVMRMMRVEEPGGVEAWLTVSRRSGEFRPEEDALIAAIGPFLRAALRGYVALERERTTASVAQDAIRRLSFGWLTLDGEGRVLDSDAQAAAMLSAGDMLVRGRDGRLGARRLRIARQIRAAIEGLVGEDMSPPRAIVLSREPWLDMLLVPSGLRAGKARPAPTLVAYVHADNWSSADRCEQLGQMFGLVPSEARLALALARGMSLAEAAGELGWTVLSTRTCSKRIYAKTGARGQADLVRFIHRSVLTIA